jgi:hypothetical protein
MAAVGVGAATAAGAMLANGRGSSTDDDAVDACSGEGSGGTLPTGDARGTIAGVTERSMLSALPGLKYASMSVSESESESLLLLLSSSEEDS